MRKFTTLVLIFVSSNLWSAMIIETIQLQHRPSNEIIPIVQPMLAPDASVTGSGYKLFIKSTPENLDQIKALLKDIDIDPNLLRIYVSMGDPSGSSPAKGRQSTRTETHGSIEIGSPDTKSDDELTVGDDRKKFDTRIYQTEKSKNKPGIQVMSVTEGYWASISMGQSIPFVTRTRNPDGTVTESVTYQQILTGYQVMPRIHDDTVTLAIRPFQQSTPDNTSIETTEMQTTVTGKLGEWIYIGGTNQEENLNNSGIAYQTRIRSTDINQVWVKVVRP